MSKILPRFLYHLTSRANYESIMASGVLKKAKPEEICSEGVYMLELTNFFKRWRCSEAWYNRNLQEQLVAKVANGDMVILRIPTKEINTDKLRIRSQNRLFPAVQLMHERMDKIAKENATKVGNYITTESEKLDRSALSLEELQKKLDTISDEALHKFPIPDWSEVAPVGHTIEGSPAKMRKLFEQRKEAIEYIYHDDIPASQIEKIGEVNVPEILGEDATYEIRYVSEKHYQNEIRKLFAALLKGTPEEKSTHLLDCNC